MPSGKNSAYRFERVPAWRARVGAVPDHVSLVPDVDLTLISHQDVVGCVNGAPNSLQPDGRAADICPLDKACVLLLVLENARSRIVPTGHRVPRAWRLKRDTGRVEDDGDLRVLVNLGPWSLRR